MLAYAGKGRRTTERIVLPEFVQDIIPLVQTSIPKMVNVIRRSSPDAGDRC